MPDDTRKQPTPRPITLLVGDGKSPQTFVPVSHVIHMEFPKVHKSTCIRCNTSIELPFYQGYGHCPTCIEELARGGTERKLVLCTGPDCPFCAVGLSPEPRIVVQEESMHDVNITPRPTWWGRLKQLFRRRKFECR